MTQLLWTKSGSTLCKPGKRSIGSFNSELQLDSSTIQPYGIASGRLVILVTDREVAHHGIRVQLDANVTLKFDTKVDNRARTHKKIESVFLDAPEAGDGCYILSPVREQLLGNESDEKLIDCSLQAGSYTYPFTLKIPGEQPLPFPFKSQYGYLEYKIVAYMRSKVGYVQVAEKPVRFRGYNNLSRYTNVAQPLRHESGFQKSVFSSKKVITAVLTTKKTGFVAGEDLTFKLAITNPKKFTVKKVLIHLVRKVTYNVNGSAKTTLIILDKFKTDEITKDEDISWIGKMTVPKNSISTFTAKPVYSVINLIQYQVTVVEYPNPLKGKVEVIIGTTNEPEESIIGRMSLLQVDEPCSQNMRKRSGSVTTRLSDNSMLSTVPPHSQLNSRTVSLMSLKTLPPQYDD